MTSQAELIEVVQRLSFCREMEGVMAVLREAARRLSGADGVTVVLREGDLCFYAEEDAIAPLWKGRRFPIEACISGWCMLHRRQVAISDIYADSRIPHEAYRPTFVQSLAMTPIRAEDPIGAIGAYWADQHEASPQELEVLQALGDAAALAFANVQLIEALQAASRRKDEFLAMLTHELRTPLAPIRNALYVLRDAAGNPDAAARSRELMERQVDHLTHLLDSLLDMARINGGKIALDRERLDLARLVYESAEDHRGVLESAGLTLRLELPQAPVWVQGDRTRLAQVLDNLLDNARKFTPPPGEVTLRLAAGNDPEQAELVLRDTGMGIEPEILPHVFEVFAQADRSLDRSRGGLGLGLSVARGLVELHGGTLEVKSGGVGQGTELTLRLPREPEPPALASDSIPGLKVRERRHILVVEDNRDAAECLRLLLEIHGYVVSVAYTGPDGVETAKSVQPDVVLCDIGLPGMSGYAVAGTLRALPETAAARLIAVTGYGSAEDRERALQAGFDLHLVKPVDPERLLGQLAAVAPGGL